MLFDLRFSVGDLYFSELAGSSKLPESLEATIEVLEIT
jgi:hypothetical protein